MAMWIVEPIDGLLAAQVLVFSGALAMVWSSVLGFIMLVPMQPWCPKVLRSFPSKAFGAAHLDWLMLGLMLGLAALTVQVFDVGIPRFAVGALVMGAWLNPLPYVFRAFGINAFVLGGSPIQVVAASLGLISSLSVLLGWGSLLLCIVGSR